MNVAFPTPLEVELVKDAAVTPSGRALWKLANSLQAVIEVPGAEPVVIVVPAGFETDFCSVPHAPLVWLVAGGIGNEAGTLHDWLYDARYTEPPYGADREQADEVLLAGLEACGVAEWQARMMFAAVRQFGSPHWKANP